MKFVFDEKKSAEAAAVLLARADGQLPTESLLTLLYLADRQSLVETGYPISGDDMVTTAAGVSLRNLLGCAHDRCSSDDAWGQKIARTGALSRLHRPADEETLSDYEYETLDAIFERYGAYPAAKLNELARALPEWSHSAETATAVDPAVILDDAGLSEEQIRDVASQVAAIHAFRTRFA